MPREGLIWEQIEADYAFCDTPREPFVFNGSRSCCARLICVVLCVRVCLSLAAQHGGVLLLWGFALLVWWWFENSRVCLYYFLSNDCQFDCRLDACLVLGSMRVVNDG
ncbi:hypothetical protein, partial [Bifidobacterium goeldii]|uniref:hypothetical protein n=1 Tax=Bifidobacterium goeldii TaxID=2306975 RepID=UPI0019CF9D44